MYPGIWDSFPSHKAPLAPLIREYLTFLQDLAWATLTNISSWEVIYSSRIAPRAAFLSHNLPQTQPALGSRSHCSPHAPDPHKLPRQAWRRNSQTGFLCPACCRILSLQFFLEVRRRHGVFERHHRDAAALGPSGQPQGASAAAPAAKMKAGVRKKPPSPITAPWAGQGAHRGSAACPKLGQEGSSVPPELCWAQLCPGCRQG